MMRRIVAAFLAGVRLMAVGDFFGAGPFARAGERVGTQ